MPRLYNALIGINILLPWVVSLLLPIKSSVLLNEVLFFGCVFLMAIGNARLARLLPIYGRWIWALSIANLISAGILNSPGLATAIPQLITLATG